MQKNSFLHDDTIQKYGNTHPDCRQKKTGETGSPPVRKPDVPIAQTFLVNTSLFCKKSACYVIFVTCSHNKSGELHII